MKIDKVKNTLWYSDTLELELAINAIIEDEGEVFTCIKIEHFQSERGNVTNMRSVLHFKRKEFDV